MNYKNSKKHITALLAAMAVAGAGTAFGQNYVDISLAPQPAAFASNSSDTFAQTVSSTALNAAAIPPDSTQASSLQFTFNAAVAGLNGDASVLGSAANYQAARAALDANPADAIRQANLARSQAQYSTFNTTITNLTRAATIAGGTTIATFSGVSGATLGSAPLVSSGGAIQVALDNANASTQVISDAVSYFKQGAGASTSANSFADLEGGVIAKIQPLNTGTVGVGALEYTAGGFRNQELNAYNTATTDLITAQAAYAAAIGNPLSTSGDIASAAGNLASAEQTYATSVNNLYTNGFAPITNTKKDELLGAVLNGSWERDAIKSNTTAIVANSNAIAAEATTRAAADTAIRTEFRAADTAIRGEFAAADVTLQNNINAEAATRLSEDTKLQANIDDEVANRIADVNAEETRARAAEVALANRATSLESRSTALEGRVGRAEGRINSLRKGVSMAAALQTPVIEAGKQNAVKAGVATVDGAQGFGIAVARRINESVQVNLDVATDFETDTAARAGVNYSF